MNKIALTIDGIKVKVEKGSTVLTAARTAGIDIPTMCFVDGLDDVPGLAKGSFALITRAHHAAVDGGSGVEMVSALIRPGTTLSVGDRRALFALPPRVLFRQDEQYALYEVGLDDSRFLMIRAVESLSVAATRPEVVLVENWDEALRQQTGN